MSKQRTLLLSYCWTEGVVQLTWSLKSHRILLIQILVTDRHMHTLYQMICYNNIPFNLVCLVILDIIILDIITLSIVTSPALALFSTLALTSSSCRSIHISEIWNKIKTSTLDFIACIMFIKFLNLQEIAWRLSSEIHYSCKNGRLYLTKRNILSPIELTKLKFCNKNIAF